MNNLTPNDRKEINEAIAAGNRVLSSLNEALKYLNKARDWGVFDILGGGLFTNLMKHSRLSDANNCLNRVNYELQNFRKELSDVSFILPSSFNIEGFLTFADFFWDGLLADFMVQSRIKKNIVAVEDAINRVTAILRSLSSL